MHITSAESSSAAQVRDPDEHILGVDYNGSTMATYPDSIASTRDSMPTLKLYLSGQPGDIFSYSIRMKDGTVVEDE